MHVTPDQQARSLFSRASGREMHPGQDLCGSPWLKPLRKNLSASAAGALRSAGAGALSWANLDCFVTADKQP